MNANYIICVDGLTGVGKTATARLVANELGIFHLKGGIFLRTVAFKTMQEGLQPNDIKGICELISRTSIELQEVKRNEYKIIVDDIDVENLLWTREVSAFVPEISIIPQVREYRKKWLRSVVKGKNVITDGRATGKEIFPDAILKVYLSCSLEERAKRRYLQYNKVTSFEEILEDIRIRDNKDSQGLIDRHTPSNDALFIDTTFLSLDAVVNLIIEAANKTLQKLSI